MLPKQYRPKGFPLCVSLTIEFNQHAVYYQTVEQWIEDQRHFGGVSWVSEEERLKAIETDSVWTCCWYPNTPVGSCSLSAASLEIVLAAIRAEEDFKDERP